MNGNRFYIFGNQLDPLADNQIKGEHYEDRGIQVIDPKEDMPGRLLTHPVGRRGLLRVRPIKGAGGRIKALRVQVFTEIGGSTVADIRAQELEVTVVDVPRFTTKGPSVEKFPGSMWFYGENGKSVGFLTDKSAGTLALPGAVERAPEGREGARKARGGES